MARELDEDELSGNWTLVGDELEQLSGRRGATKLGFALLLRFYAVHGMFLSGRSDLPDQAVAHVARLVDVPASDFGFYEWDGRTIKAHRADIRRYFGFRECSVADADKAAEWLAANVCEKERQAAAAHRLHRGAAAPVHLGDHSPGLRRDARDQPRPALHLPARWLRDRDLQRETESGLNAVENYNGVNDFCLRNDGTDRRIRDRPDVLEPRARRIRQRNLPHSRTTVRLA